ncbi:precorrin-6Y C5,15-methyltransferase (decarboxylating) subunit CbiT [Sulfurimonas sediminis]|uniref:Precorrin-6Y C5,15-methyltransferase (Decarboxylating) subunit CbiT n=1 Tax=Sulfurimonas sediminis TaxID=2590020 RepID=A0A7M1AZ23_9BACT|nr:precorrin-6Y C5,15-methyltransferase (decarboxylating) subunit CbiT [Sulfurimonas sediminis]QOP42556.1 precorrin-6Y C5,15-methyltransferase (decarboxylating) subunit CbiT [Sulfurimonas sediminis]
MVTIAGSGMGAYNFDNVDVDFSKFKMIFCDQNYETSLQNVTKGSFKVVKEAILQNLDKEILYVVSGSPTFFSGAILIINALKKQNIAFKIIDNTSSLNYMLAHEGVSLVKTGITTLHGKSFVDLENFLTKEYTFVVCDDATPRILADATQFLDEEDMSITLGERFGYDDERFSTTTLKKMIQSPPKMPYSLLIKRNYKPLENISSEESIEHENGMITKSYKRHISLQNLELQPNMLLWDIGAGSGSVSIDGYKRYKVKTILFEKNPKRSAMIKNSLKKHKILDTKLYEGEASEDYKKEPSTPERIFVGGGGEKVIAELDYLYERLAEGGIMVANFVTLTNLTQAITVLKEGEIAFDVKSISLTTYKMKLLMPEPERVMHQIIIKKAKND